MQNIFINFLAFTESLVTAAEFAIFKALDLKSLFLCLKWTRALPWNTSVKFSSLLTLTSLVLNLTSQKNGDPPWEYASSRADHLSEGMHGNYQTGFNLASFGNLS